MTTPKPPPGMGDGSVRALRHAREIAADLRWRGVAVPDVYRHMAAEFDQLVRDGRYAAWLGGQ